MRDLGPGRVKRYFFCSAHVASCLFPLFPLGSLLGWGHQPGGLSACVWPPCISLLSTGAQGSEENRAELQAWVCPVTWTSCLAHSPPACSEQPTCAGQVGTAERMVLQPHRDMRASRALSPRQDPLQVSGWGSCPRQQGAFVTWEMLAEGHLFWVASCQSPGAGGQGGPPDIELKRPDSSV